MTLLPPEFPKLSTTLESQRVMISVSNEQLANIFRGAFGAATVAQAASAETNQLRQIILAMHNFAESYKFLPPRETRLPDATPLLSWRVHLLPYLGELALYQQFHLNEPWDSEHNKALITKMPSVYVTDKALAAKGLTQFAAPTLSGSLWSGNDKPLYFDKVTDGTSITIAIWIAPAESAVIWTKPSEPQLDDNNLVKQFFGDRETVAIGVLDGSVRTITSASDPATLKAAITIGGGEVFDFEDLSK